MQEAGVQQAPSLAQHVEELRRLELARGGFQERGFVTS